jgi:ribosomal protein S18 acetylase RimI-like enzyme
MIIEIRTPNSDMEWQNYYDLRYRILRKPWAQLLGSERNEGDATGIHLAIFENRIIKAIARLDISGEHTGQVRFVAVETNEQGKGFGKLIMDEAEKISKERGDRKMILHARETALNFYHKLGYKLVEKSHLLFGEIQHFLMEKEF